MIFTNYQIIKQLDFIEITLTLYYNTDIHRFIFADYMFYFGK